MYARMMRNELPLDKAALDALIPIMHRDVPTLQLWIIRPKIVTGSEERFTQFLDMVRKGTGPVRFPIFRGTHFPWPGGQNPTSPRDFQYARDKSASYLAKFDAGEPVVTTRMTSWTKSPETAVDFAKNARLREGWSDDGYVHVIESPGVMFDVEAAYLRQKRRFVKYPLSDEKEVIEREQEVIMPPGIELAPAGRVGHFWVWRRIN
jgi:hypothetical protein